MENYGLTATEEFAEQLLKLSNYAFSYGIESIPNDQKLKSAEDWTAQEMKFFMDKCREGFKLSQVLLIDEILYYQQKSNEIKEEIKKYRSKHNKKKVEELINVGKVVSRRLHNLSHIADGIVIQMLAHRVDIAKRLHLGEKSRKLLVHSNLRHAMEEADKLNKNSGIFAMISDITSYIQIGDLLVTDEKEGIYIRELKEGKTNQKLRNFIDLNLEQGISCPNFESDFTEKENIQMRRMIRQDKRAIQAVEVINFDKGTDLATGAQITVKTPTIDFVYYDSIFLEMRDELKTKSWSYRLLEDTVHVGLYQGEIMTAMANYVIPSILKRQSEHHILIDLMQITEDVSETLFAKPLPRDFVIKIMTGQIKAIIGINLDQLIRVFNSNGVKSYWLSTAETAKLRGMTKGVKVVISKNQAIAIEVSEGEVAVVSGGIISKIAFDSILPSSLAVSMASSTSPL